LPGQRAGWKELVRERDPRRDPVRRLAREGVVQRLSERLLGRRGPAAAGGRSRDGTASDREADEGEREDDEPGGGDGAEQLHDEPFSRSTSVVTAVSETSLRAGSSTATLAPSAYARPPWRSAVALTMASPSPEPGTSWFPRQN